jgi:membrane-associated protease RseP (regulator of RpoE activity)
VPVALLAATVFCQAAAAQRTTTACSADEIVAWMGIESMDCSNCTVRTDPDEGGLATGEWSFRAEPVVRRVTAGGPADGVLRAGDVLVAVNGALITTAEGGRRFSTRQPGRPLTFAIRRDGRVQTVQLTPAGVCRADRRIASAVPGGSVQVPRSELPPAAVTPPRVTYPQEPQPMRVMDPAGGQSGLLLPSGRLGFGFSCSDCGWERGARGGEPRWFFNSPPQIYNVDPGSPADRAGLRRGDVITHVDGEDIVSESGGREFGVIRPGQTVRLTYRRGSSVRNARLQADDRDGLAAFTAAAATIRRELEQLLEDRPSTAQLRRELEELARLLDPSSAREAPLLDVPNEQRSQQSAVRYSGTVGNAEVEVRSSGSVITTILEPGKDLLIVLDGARIRIRAADQREE